MKNKKIEKKIMIPIGSSMEIECECGRKHRVVNTSEGAFLIVKLVNVRKGETNE